jgi:glutathione peroxidase-family protein
VICVDPAPGRGHLTASDLFPPFTCRSDISLYSFLTRAQGGDVRWNFTKFLAGEDGGIPARFEPGVTPDAAELAAAIEQALQ